MNLEIGEAAGKVWHFLDRIPHSTFGKAYKSLTMDPSLFYMAIGWLAREDKIVFEGTGKKRTLSLKQGAEGL